MLKEQLLDKFNELTFSLNMLGEIRKICANWLILENKNITANRNDRLIVYVLHELCSDISNHLHHIEQRTTEHKTAEQIVRQPLEAVIKRIGANDVEETLTTLNNAIAAVTKLRTI